MTTAVPPLPADMVDSPKFSAYNLINVGYKQVNGTPVPATILVPKNVKPGAYPVIVRWHGGCFITGHRLLPDWFGSWILELAAMNTAIIVSPDYRLLPEASALDVLQDIRDFYNWLATSGNFASHLPEGVTPDIDHLLVTGESAGGWHALQSALLPASRERISAVISHYPMIDMRDPHYTGDYEKQLFTPTAPQLDRSVLQDFLSNLKGDEVVTSGIPPDRVPVVISAMQQGAFGTFFGNDSTLYPLEMLDEVKDLPPIWILHGTDDTVIPVEGTRKFEQKLKEKVPHSKLHLSYEAGDHGFDNEPGIGLHTGWVKSGVEFIGKYWPAEIGKGV